VCPVRHRDEIARDTGVAQRLLHSHRLLVGDAHVRRAVDEQEGRQARVDAADRRAVAEGLAGGLVELGPAEECAHRHAQASAAVGIGLKVDRREEGHHRGDPRVVRHPDGGIGHEVAPG